jgi:hypothetical protein
MVPKLRWFEPDDPAIEIDWRAAALIMATLFLNFPFWFIHGIDLAPFSPAPLYAGLLAIVALLITGLFFIGPALATQLAKKPLFGIIEDSVGSIPALGLRLCCVTFLVLWISQMVASGLLMQFMRREVSPTETGIIYVAVLVFLSITSFQSLSVTAGLARFTNRLGVAILIAALLRVRQGWPAILDGFPLSFGRLLVLDSWHGLSVLAFYTAPLALLAANFGYRLRERRAVANAALMGLAVPLFGTLLIVGAIEIATWKSRFYQPSLNPNVAMALWGQAAGRFLPGLMMVTAITMFGAVRFGLKALMDLVSIGAPGGTATRILLGGLIGAIGLGCLYPYSPELSTALEYSVQCLAVISAVLTADLVSGRRVEHARRIDWVGVIALLAGLVTPLWMRLLMVAVAADPWWHPWFLPSYGVGFLVCLLGRAIFPQTSGSTTISASSDRSGDPSVDAALGRAPQGRPSDRSKGFNDAG